MEIQIETERLILRIPSLDDLDRWTEMLTDAKAAQFIGGPQPRPVVWRMILSMVGAWHVTGVSMFSVIEKERGLWIGRIGPWQPLDWPGTEVGWGLHPDAWGKGYALEAAIASMDYAADSLGWTEIIHCINAENAPSQALARRLGSRILRQARLPAPYQHEVVDVWGQTRDEWTVNRAKITRPEEQTRDRPASHAPSA
jgi:RimJ/RimL family protein N-acetyltransferase